LLALAFEAESVDGEAELVDGVEAAGALADASVLVEEPLAPESPLALAVDAAGFSAEPFSLGCARVSVE
jgi:hypothetical protein